MFDPCRDQEYKGKRIPCTGNNGYDCDDCELTRLRRENDHLKSRIKTELEPRLRIEERAYDRRVTGG